MRKKRFSRRVRRMLSVCLAATMATTCMPQTELWHLEMKKVVKAADSTVTVDSTAIVQQIDSKTENRPGIPDGKLLNELKRLVNTSLGRDIKTDITFGELMAYDGEIDLSAIGTDITSISGLGYARKAKVINLTNVPITTIDDYEFDGCTGLTKIILPQKLTTLGKFAFRNCKNLTTITLPETVTSIGESAFDACVSLGALTIPNGVNNIAKGAFGGCTSLKSMTITNPNIVLGASVFEGCSSLETVNLPEGIKTIPVSFFASSGIKEITLPSTVTSIGQTAFMSTRNLSSIDLTNCIGLTTIENNAFAASGIAKIQLPNSLQLIKSNAFEASNLESIVIPDSVMGNGDANGKSGIGELAFWNCHSLKNVSLPKGISRLNEGTFKGCISLESVEIRDAANSILESIEKEAFSGCYSLENTNFLNGLKLLKEIKERAFAYDVKDNLSEVLTRKDIYGNTLYYGGLTSISLPDSVTTVDKTAFEYQYNVENITLGNGITELQDSIFSGFVNLRHIKLSDRLVTIGNKAFNNCIMLNEINFPNTLQTIGESAFESCGTASTISNIAYDLYYVDPTKIYDQRPAGNNTAGEYLVYTKDTEYNQQIVEKVIEPDAMIAKQENETKNVPAGYELCYVVAEKRYVNAHEVYTSSEFSKKRYIHYTYDEEQGVISGNENIYTDSEDATQGTSLVPKSGYTGYYVRDNVSNKLNVRNYLGITSLNLPDSVTTLGKRAFANCYNLEKIVLSEKIEEISEGAFCVDKAALLSKYDWTDTKNTELLGKYITTRSVTLPQKLKIVAAKAFYGNTNMTWTNAALPTTIELIGESAFEECKCIKEVIVPSRTKEIGKRAFFGCCEYKKLDDKMQGYVVYDVNKDSGLREIDMTQANSLTTIGDNAFALNTITNCTIPDKVTVLPQALFQDCYYLQKVTCSDNTQEVKEKVFSNCKSLVSITIPAQATISYLAFCGWDIGDFTFSVTDPEEVSVAMGETVSLPINTFLADYLRNEMKITEKNGTTGFISFANTSKEKINGSNILKANVTGVKEGTTKISMEGTINFLLYGSTIIAKAPEVMVTVNVTSKKCTDIVDGKSSQVISIEDTSRKVQLSPQILPVDCTEKNVWKSENENVVGVEPISYIKDGVLTTSASTVLVPKGLGTSKVTLKCGSVKKDYQVNVVVPATQIRIDNNQIRVKETEEKEISISPTMTYDSTKYTVEQWENYGDIAGYTSSDINVVQVTETGKVIPISAGTATITVTALGSGVSTSVQVIVEADAPKMHFEDKNGKEITATDALNVQYGEEFTLYFGTNPAESLAKINYEFSNLAQNDMFSYISTGEKSITTANKGTQNKAVSMTFKADKVGSGEITILPAVYEKKEEVAVTRTVNVIASMKEAVFATVNKMTVGEAVSVFGYLSTDAGKAEKIEDLKNITTDQVSFESSNTEIATVDAATGVVTAVKEGKVSITMKITNPYNNGKTTNKRLSITVQKPEVTDIQLSSSDGQGVVKKGETVQLQVAFVPESASDNVTYESLNPTIASVSKTGVVTGLKAGTAEIKVTTATKKIAKTIFITVTDGSATNSSQGTIGKVLGLKAVNKKGKKVRLSWKKVKNATGYRILYATNRKFTKNKRTVVIAKNSVARVIKGLKKGTTYYVKVQAFQKQGNDYVYGKYSAVKKVKVKK